jgi:hypothetical protein
MSLIPDASMRPGQGLSMDHFWPRGSRHIKGIGAMDTMLAKVGNWEAVAQVPQACERSMSCHVGLSHTSEDDSHGGKTG